MSIWIEPGPKGELNARLMPVPELTLMGNEPVAVALHEATRIRYTLPAVPLNVTAELSPHDPPASSLHASSGPPHAPYTVRFVSKPPQPVLIATGPEQAGM